MITDSKGAETGKKPVPSPVVVEVVITGDDAVLTITGAQILDSDISGKTRIVFADSHEEYCTING